MPPDVWRSVDSGDAVNYGSTVTGQSPLWPNVEHRTYCTSGAGRPWSDAAERLPVGHDHQLLRSNVIRTVPRCDDVVSDDVVAATAVLTGVAFDRLRSCSAVRYLPIVAFASVGLAMPCARVPGGSPSGV